MNIIIVDDDPFVCLSLKTILEASEEIQVLETGTDGKDAITLYCQYQPDILLMDIWVKNGDPVNRFEHGGFGLGAALIKHPDLDTMCARMDHMERYIRVITK